MFIKEGAMGRSRIPLISYGNHYDHNKFEPIENQSAFFNKPMGGYWANEFGTKNYNWIQWCTDAGFFENKPKEYRTIYTRFYLKRTARVITIDNRKDLIKTINSYRIHNAYEGEAPEYAIDYELLQKDYDVIHVTQRACWECRYPFSNKYATLNVWDIDTYLIMNQEAIDEASIILC